MEKEVIIDDKLKQLLAEQKDTDIEIGFGKGAFVLGKARLYKDVNFIGYEIKNEFVEIVKDTIKKEALTEEALRKHPTLFAKYSEKEIEQWVYQTYLADPDFDVVLKPERYRNDRYFERCIRYCHLRFTGG